MSAQAHSPIFGTPGRVFKRKRKWWIDFSVAGKRYREPASYKKHLAQRALARRISEVEQGNHVPSSTRTTLRGYKSEFLTWAKDRKKSWRRDQNSLDHLLRHLGDIPLARIDHSHVEKYQKARATEPDGRGKVPTNATINREVACLRTLINRAVRDKVIARSGIERVAGLPEHNERNRVLTEDEIQRLCAAAPDWLRPIIIVASRTAMRRSEIIKHVTWESVDLDAGFVRLPSAGTKNGKPRSVPLDDVVLKVLSDLPRPEHGGPVFTIEGREIHTDSISKAFKRVAKKAKVEGVVFHDLRHTACTNWHKAGVDQHTIMKASGHQTTAMFRRYNTITEDRLNVIKRAVRESGPQATGGEADRSAGATSTQHAL